VAAIKIDDPWGTFVLSVFKLNSLILQAGDNMTQPIGQSSARWQVLSRATKPQTVAQIARDMGHARQGVQRVADILVQEHLMTYQDHPTDRRTQLLHLTPQGLQVLSLIHTRRVEWSEQIMKKLELKQLIELTNSLEELSQTLEVEIILDND
jgi:DNA-binding MarR family transcriptional regulator